MTDGILIVGSVAFDHIFTIQPTIRQEVPLDSGELNHINMRFVSSSSTKIIDGGTGSNIAYSCSMLVNETPVYLFSAVGNDFMNSMGQKLQDLGVIHRSVVFDQPTARSLQISDQNKEQIIIWQPNAYAEISNVNLTDRMSEEEIKSCNRAIFAPGTPESTHIHMKTYRKYNQNGQVFFDPGQMVNFYDLETFKECCKLSNVILLNDAELLKVKNSFKLSPSVMLNELDIDALVLTKGEDGSEIITKSGSVTIPVYSEKLETEQTIEATGAGDAYRGGLLAALSRGLSFEDACQVGSVIAFKSITQDGAQIHQTNWQAVSSLAQDL